MKFLFRILIVVTFLAIIFYYSSTDSSKPLEGPEPEITEVDNAEDIELNSEMLEKPTTGISTYIGKSSQEVLEEFDEPLRVDETPYDYEWWVYDQYEMYIMFAVQDGIVTQVYTNSTAYDVSPYNMYMSSDDVYRMTIVDGEVSVELDGDDNVYLFSMNNYDMKYRILVQFGDIYAQLYIDESSEKLIGIRFMDGQTLVTHKSYEVQVIGELSENPKIVVSDTINEANAEQLFDLTNVFRLKEKLPTLAYSDALSQIAVAHSIEMYEGQFVSHDSPTTGSLKDRVATIGLIYEDIDENIATGFFDAIEATHGLLNSKEHRKLMYNEKFKEIGVGVQDRYYTQIFFNPVDDEQ